MLAADTRKSKRFQALIIAVLLAMGACALYAQTITTGEIAGTITDSSGAVVAGAAVTAKEISTGDSRTVQSSSTGIYRIGLLKPGTYAISGSAKGLKSDLMTGVVVGVGQAKSLDLVLKLEQSKEEVTVVAEEVMLQTENANVTTTFTRQQVDLLPAPGGDITTVAFTVPGVVVSTGAGYGNFSSNGLPGTSNLFSTNGNDNMYPYLNLIISGASNLTLGSNEFQEAVLNSQIPVIVDFFSDECPPCEVLAPIYEKMAEKCELGPPERFPDLHQRS